MNCPKCGTALVVDEGTTRLSYLGVASQLVAVYVASARKHGSVKPEWDLFQEASAYVATLELPYERTDDEN